MSDKEGKKGGRPTKPPGERKVKVNVMVSPALLDRIRHKAEQSNDSISRVIENYAREGAERNGLV